MHKVFRSLKEKDEKCSNYKFSIKDFVISHLFFQKKKKVSILYLTQKKKKRKKKQYLRRSKSIIMIRTIGYSFWQDERLRVQYLPQQKAPWLCQRQNLNLTIGYSFETTKDLLKRQVK